MQRVLAVRQYFLFCRRTSEGISLPSLRVAGRKDSEVGAGKDFVEWVDPGAGGQVAVNKGAAALPQRASSTPRMAVREQPLAYHRPYLPFAMPGELPRSHERAHSFTRPLQLCPPARTLPAVASTTTCESANARRRGRPPFAVNTSESGERTPLFSRQLYEGHGLFGSLRGRQRETRRRPLFSARSCTLAQPFACDPTAERLPVCHQKARALPFPPEADREIGLDTAKACAKAGHTLEAVLLMLRPEFMIPDAVVLLSRVCPVKFALPRITRGAAALTAFGSRITCTLVLRLWH
ncbi:hypothetical protein PSPO01_13998 [Paraphaeosphaeria sporulosa]